MDKNTVFFKDITQAALLTLLESDNDIDFISKGEVDGRYDLSMTLKAEQAIVVYAEHIQLLTLDPIEGLLTKDISRTSYKAVEVA